jgi:hypothetical protein
MYTFARRTIPTKGADMTKQLTKEDVTPYVGGQIEIQNPNEGYIFRGEILTITINGEGDSAVLSVTLSWMARGIGLPPIGWETDDELDYGLGLAMSVTSRLSDARLRVKPSIIGEIIVLFPPGGSRLDPALVEGLVLARG